MKIKNEESGCAMQAVRKEILHSSLFILHFLKYCENNHCRCRRSRHTFGQTIVSRKQDIILMDDNEERMSTLSSNFDLMTVTASPTSIKGLKEVGVGEADLFIAVTPDESRNITACMLATNLGAVKTVGRIDNYEYLLPKTRNSSKIGGRLAYLSGNACSKRDCIFHPYELGAPMVGILWRCTDSDRG